MDHPLFSQMPLISWMPSILSFFLVGCGGSASLPDKNDTALAALYLPGLDIQFVELSVSDTTVSRGDDLPITLHIRLQTDELSNAHFGSLIGFSRSDDGLDTDWRAEVWWEETLFSETKDIDLSGPLVIDQGLDGPFFICARLDYTNDVEENNETNNLNCTQEAIEVGP